MVAEAYNACLACLSPEDAYLLSLDYQLLCDEFDELWEKAEEAATTVYASAILFGAFEY